MGKSFRSLVATIVALTALGGRATAQQEPNPNLPPTYGSVKLSAGFTPDPFLKPVQAGGNLRTNLAGVNAFVARAPDFSLHYQAGESALVFSAKSVGDTTLLINLPNGQWVADDDGGGGLDPMIRIDRPASGRYDIYVGTFQKDLVAATLHITEIDRAAKPPVVVDSNLPECHIVSAGIDDYRTQTKLKGCLNDARNTVAAFQRQVGTKYRAVKERVLLDSSASHGAILSSFAGLTKQGAAGDTVVLFLSGHGARTSGNKGNTWFFLPVDFHPQRFTNTALTDRQILDTADQLVRQRKNVMIIVDACHCGQLAVAAQPYLARYSNGQPGGLALFLSSAPDQESTAMGNYSAYAKAFADSMAGGGDLDRDGKITLGEMQIDTKKRTANLLTAARISQRQDAIVTWSPSLSKDVVMAYAGARPAVQPLTATLPSERPRRFVGNENLAGFGKLSFDLYSNGVAVMIDAQATTEGLWRQDGNQFTLSFVNGAVVYTGTLNGTTLSGTATSPAARQQGVRSWNWNVQQQAGQ